MPGSKRILTLFGTRPEVIKLWPVIDQLEQHPDTFEIVNVTSAQHQDLLYPLVDLFGIRVDHDLGVMEKDQTPNDVCARVIERLGAVLGSERPHLVLVQGDTTTALSGALAAFHHRIPVGHVEAGLRSGSATSPFPEEMNRRLISRLARYHFAPTSGNRHSLLAEGIPERSIFVTGNSIVDALHAILSKHQPGHRMQQILDAARGKRLLVLTAHRRENHDALGAYFGVLRSFVMKHPDVFLAFPVHPNPRVREAADLAFRSHPRIWMCEPLHYPDFVRLLSEAWLIVSDSGGIQEEAPTLKKPVLVLRQSTERPEALDNGAVRLAGGDPGHLAGLLEDAHGDRGWTRAIRSAKNPFGQGDSGRQIVAAIARVLGVPLIAEPTTTKCPQAARNRHIAIGMNEAKASASS